MEINWKATSKIKACHKIINIIIIEESSSWNTKRLIEIAVTIFAKATVRLDTNVLIMSTLGNNLRDSFISK